ncbi:MAG: RNA polymerase sigma-70 factor (TIGR02943 family) [Crocinitomix sp.]|jgi:RNA polymerase sigma-70 factor (TIGR02943 family)
MEKLTNIDTSQWVDEYADMLFNFAAVRVSDSDLAKDLVQDTFVSALKGIDKFQGKSTVKTWLFSILKRKIIDHWRKQESRKTKPMSFFTTDGMMKGKFLETYSPKGRLSEVEEKMENAELRQAITECIGSLPSKWQGIVVDKMVDEKESEEVCNNHDITPSNLWVIVHRAKLQLRDCLEKKWFV